mmetsp:Transcript_18068/g.16169  ORF Transcript_18068/g.16169 Transcript_18068/m.16169 type:complete len:168 (-) Transcript_18068:305-808(-)
MEMKLTIHVHTAQEVTPRPPYLDQIKYIHSTQKDIKSFNFKDAPNNRELIMDVFDHVSSILSAVQSPIYDLTNDSNHFDVRTPNLNSRNDQSSVSFEGVLKPSKIRSEKIKRRSTLMVKERRRSQKLKPASFGFGFTDCRNKNRVISAATTTSYAQSLCCQFTPIDP